MVGNQIIDCGVGLNIVAMGFNSFVLYCALGGWLFKRVNLDKVGDFGLVVAVKLMADLGSNCWLRCPIILSRVEFDISIQARPHFTQIPKHTHC